MCAGDPPGSQVSIVQQRRQQGGVLAGQLQEALIRRSHLQLLVGQQREAAWGCLGMAQQAITCNSMRTKMDSEPQAQQGLICEAVQSYS